MSLDRRRLLALAAASLALPNSARAAAAHEGGRLLQRELDAKAGQTVRLPRGTTFADGLRLPPGTRLVAEGRGAVLRLAGRGPLLSLVPGESVTVEGVILDGAGLELPEGRALLEAEGVPDLRLDDVSVIGAGGLGARLVGCGGRMRGCTLTGHAGAALLALDSTGLAITDNTIADCGANGILVWRSSSGEDGTLVRGNRVSRIRADPGGDGQHGNGINVYRAGGVVVNGNLLRQVAFTGVRVNGGTNTIVTGNSCAEAGETAFYVEFAWAGALVQGNLAAGCAQGISMTNLDHGGRGAVCAGNVVRDATRRLPQGGDGWGVGLHAEAEVALTGNLVDRAGRIGLKLGWGEALRDVVATGNLVCDAPIGIGASIAPGAGRAQMVGNTVSRASRAAFAGMKWNEVADASLVANAGRYPKLVIASNRVE